MRSVSYLFCSRQLLSVILICISGNFTPTAIAEGEEDIVFRQAQSGDETEFNVNSGILIVEGEFLPPPYHILTLPSGEVLVNDHAIDFKRQAERPQTVSRRTRGEWREDSEYNEDTVASFIYGTLLFRGVLVCQAGELPYSLATASSASEFLNVTLNEGTDHSEMPAWLVGSLTDLRKDITFRRYAREYVRTVEETELSNRSATGRVRLLEQAAYPLSSVGMLLVVLATGQLLAVRPPKRDELHLPSSDASGNTIRFAAMIVGFSILDLIWTLLASHDGSMKELNPLGARLITDPMMLVLFKVATTTTSVGILLYLRHHQRVTLASWWMCLVLTLLTARWLTFNSLLV